jgi:hypothetical protein
MLREKKKVTIQARIDNRLLNDIKKYQEYFINKKSKSRCVRELLENSLDIFFDYETGLK